jgi:hypothetical protein
MRFDTEPSGMRKETASERSDRWKKLELDGGIDDYLMRVGDYKGKVVEDAPQGSGEYLRKYEVVLADGTKRKFEAIGGEE